MKCLTPWSELTVVFFLVNLTGTRCLTGCFALMVGLEGRALGVQHLPELVASSAEKRKV